MKFVSPNFFNEAKLNLIFTKPNLFSIKFLKLDYFSLEVVESHFIFNIKLNINTNALTKAVLNKISKDTFRNSHSK